MNILDVTIMLPEPNHIDTALVEAAKRSTLIEALSYLAIWESERIVKQAIRNNENNVTLENGGKWNTCFNHTFTLFINKYGHLYKVYEELSK